MKVAIMQPYFLPHPREPLVRSGLETFFDSPPFFFRAALNFLSKEAVSAAGIDSIWATGGV